MGEKITGTNWRQRRCPAWEAWSPRRTCSPALCCLCSCWPAPSAASAPPAAASTGLCCPAIYTEGNYAALHTHRGGLCWPATNRWGLCCSANTQRGIMLPCNTQRGIMLPCNTQRGIMLPCNTQRGIMLPCNTQRWGLCWSGTHREELCCPATHRGRLSCPATHRGKLCCPATRVLCCQSHPPPPAMQCTVGIHAALQYTCTVGTSDFDAQMSDIKI